MLELMVVLSIMAAIVTLVIPQIGSRNNEMKATVRRFTVLSRHLNQVAKMQNATFRLVIDLGSTDDPPLERKQSYWIEKTTKRFVVDAEGESFRGLTEAELEDLDDDEKNKANPGGFEMDSTVLKNVQTLTPGMRFSSVEFSGQDKPIEEGVVYIHYFAKGLSDEAAIHLAVGDPREKEDLLEWTLITHPITGRIDIIAKNISIRDILKQ